MINLNTNVSSIMPHTNKLMHQVEKSPDSIGKKADFTKTVKAAGDFISEVDDLQRSSDMSIKDLLAGRNSDITSVVTAVAEADLSFKLLIGVRNKLIEAYKQTMNMQI